VVPPDRRRAKDGLNGTRLAFLHVAVGARSRRITIVVTPGSGNGRALGRALALRDGLERRGHRATLEAFADLDTLRAWASHGGAPCSLLICIGGDGTLCTAAGWAVRRSVPFLAIPAGFGNLFAGALGQPRRLEKAIELVDHGTFLAVDVGLRNGEPFLCHESFGFLQSIQDRTEAVTDQPRGGWRRALAYYRTAVCHMRESPLPRLRVAVDHRVVAADAAIVTVSNVATYGPWLPLTPEASPIDGLLDVFVMLGRSRREIATRLVAHQLRVSSPDERAMLYRAQRVSVTGPDGVRDEMTLLPGRLTVVVSRETAEALQQDRTRIEVAAPLGRAEVA